MKKQHNPSTISLKQALPYIASHKSKTVVFILPTDLILSSTKERLGADFWHDLVSCHNFGLRCVICIAQTHASSQNTSKKNAIVTEKQLEDINTVLMEKRALCLANLTRAAQSLGRHILALYGNWLLAQPMGIIDAVDYQKSGKLRKIDFSAIKRTLDEDAIVIMDNIATDKTGESYFLTTREIVGTLARSLQADKIITYTKSLPEHFFKYALDVGEAQEGASDTVPTPQKPEWIERFIENALHFCRDCLVNRVHLIPADTENSLLCELFTPQGYGMMIHRDLYECLSIPTKADMFDIQALINSLVEKGIFRPRPIKTIEDNRENFRIIKQDDVFIGCAAVSPITGQNDYGELECFAIAPEYANDGYGKRLLRSMERFAREKGYTYLVAMTTQSATWFQEQGYKTTSQKINVPRECRERNAKALMKRLSA